MQRRRKSFVGFTLVELLVVIGIIAVLISILLAALMSVRRAALRIVCLSQQRQIGMAMRMYAETYKSYMHQRQSQGNFPNSLIGGPRYKPQDGFGAANSYPDYMLGWEANALFRFLNYPTKELASEVLNGPERLFTCPANNSRNTASRNRYWPNGSGRCDFFGNGTETDYNWVLLSYNFYSQSYLWTNCNPAGTPPEPTYSPLTVASPGSWALMSCQIVSYQGNMARVSSHWDRRTNQPAGANHLFADGHAEWVDWDRGRNMRMNHAPAAGGNDWKLYWRRTMERP